VFDLLPEPQCVHCEHDIIPECDCEDLCTHCKVAQSLQRVSRTECCPVHGEFPAGDTIIRTNALNNNGKNQLHTFMVLKLINPADGKTGFVFVLTAVPKTPTMKCKKDGTNKLVAIISGPRGALLYDSCSSLSAFFESRLDKNAADNPKSSFKKFAGEPALVSHIAATQPISNGTHDFAHELGTIFQSEDMPVPIREAFEFSIKEMFRCWGGIPPVGKNAIAEATALYIAGICLADSSHKHLMGKWTVSEQINMIAALLGTTPNLDAFTHLLDADANIVTGRVSAAALEAVNIAPSTVLDLLATVNGETDFDDLANTLAIAAKGNSESTVAARAILNGFITQARHEAADDDAKLKLIGRIEFATETLIESTKRKLPLETRTAAAKKQAM
jgi:hypothetical protein